MTDIRTGIGIWSSRFVDPRSAADYAKGLDAAGHIDQFVLWDQLTSWWPTACGSRRTLRVHRRHPPRAPGAGPDDAHAGQAAGGKGTLCLGCGEMRNINPFGRKRSMGLKRLNESLQILRLLLKEERLVDFDGELWKLKDAWIGNAGKDKAPEVVAMGGGPRLIEMALKYADGFGTGSPFVYADPEKYGEAIRGHKQTLTGLGRDPEAYTFALHHTVFVLEDKDEFEQYVDNPLLKWYAGRHRRSDQPERLGPEGWSRSCRATGTTRCT